MNFAIISPTRVEVDGLDAGLLGPFIRAHPEMAAQIDAELIRWHASHVRAEQAKDAEVAQAKALAEARAVSAEESFIAKKSEISKQMDDMAEAHAATVAALTADLATLGTKEEAQEIRKEQERQAILAQRAELDAKLAALEEGPLPAITKGVQ